MYPIVKYLVVCVMLFESSFVIGQKAYFQQKVDSRIEVTLDDKNHRLVANIQMNYENRSPDTLSFIWIHLWPNAYSDRRSAFSEQKLRQGDAKFYFSEEEKLGGISKLDFTVNGRKASWEYHPEHRDIALLRLPEPLKPGQTADIATPFEVDIPASFSRLGHVQTSYQITQWYPKPAVYDRKGWHPMPYLDQGEFYSEFGNFSVSITLPENYVVAASGVLLTDSEKEFLQNKEKQTREWLAGSKYKYKPDTFPASSAKLKTIEFRAEEVHDFAWFADKRFQVLRDTAQIAGNKKVDCWAMFPPSAAKIWEKGAFYVRRAVEMYSGLVGPYSWPHATAVLSALSAGGGMEYPMITVIGSSATARELDDVITHEVGHNWFYGMLASNERDHAWMDEGMNVYYENVYMMRYYGSNNLFEVPKFILDTLQNGSLIEAGINILARESIDLPSDSPSDAFSNVGYGLQVYMKPAFAMSWLKEYAGEKQFNKAMQAYFAEWRMRHPYPEDLRESWKKSGLDVEWFFDLMQTSKHPDFQLKKIKKQGNTYQLTIRQSKDLAAPFPVTAFKDGEEVTTQWFPAHSGMMELVFPVDSADLFVVDYYRKTLDYRRKNNSRRTSGIFPSVEPVRLRMFAPIENYRRSVIAALPWMGWNNYDKFMLGAVVYNSPLPTRRLQYYIAPGYGFNSQNLVGLADVRLHFFPGGIFPKITMGGSLKSFTYGISTKYNAETQYFRIAPEIHAELADRSTSFIHALNFRTIITGVEELIFGGQDGIEFEKVSYTAPKTIYEIRYEGFQRKKPNSFRYTVALEHQNYQDLGEKNEYWRMSATWLQDFYYSNTRKVTVRLFGGYFLDNSRRESTSGDPRLARGTLALASQGYNDYRFDEVFLGRSEASGIWSRQVSPWTDGGFKNAFGRSYSSVLGNSNNYVFAANIRADLPRRLPFGIPLKPYVDFAIYDPAGLPASSQEGTFIWSGGVMLSFFSGVMEIYFPLINDKAVTDQYKISGGGYWNRVSFSLNLGGLNPEKLTADFIR